MMRFILAILLLSGCVSEQAIELAKKNQRVIEVQSKAACDLGEDTTVALLSANVKAAFLDLRLKEAESPVMTKEAKAELYRSTEEAVQQEIELTRKIYREAWTRFREQFAYAHEAGTLNLVAWGGMQGFIGWLAKSTGEVLEETADWAKYNSLKQPPAAPRVEPPQ